MDNDSLSPNFDWVYRGVIADICALNWSALSEEDIVASAWAYYFFSVQFRENLEEARQLFPYDDRLLELEQGECNTDNLSPWPDVAVVGERLNHDEFMRRLLSLRPIPDDRRQQFMAIGERYLRDVRQFDSLTKALSLTTYEDGGLERVFRAMLRSAESSDPLIQAFRHFLSEHVRFDSDPHGGHGALIRHLQSDDRVLPLWLAFKNVLLACVPALQAEAAGQTATCDDQAEQHDRAVAA